VRRTPNEKPTVSNRLPEKSKMKMSCY
jgi:hypothetical protein